MRHVRTDPQFMHVNTYPPLHVAHTHTAPSRRIIRITRLPHVTSSAHSRTSRCAIRITPTSYEAMLLIRSTRPKSNVADSFSPKKAIFGPSEDKYPKG
jgi:hypothetical protein